MRRFLARLVLEMIVTNGAVPAHCGDERALIEYMPLSIFEDQGHNPEHIVVTDASTGTSYTPRSRLAMSRDLALDVALLVAGVWGLLRDLTADTRTPRTLVA